jgi:hypothetical protein
MHLVKKVKPSERASIKVALGCSAILILAGCGSTTPLIDRQMGKSLESATNAQVIEPSRESRKVSAPPLAREMERSFQNHVAGGSSGTSGSAGSSTSSASSTSQAK